MSKRQRRRGGAGFFWGLLLGIAIGAALALLFAPDAPDRDGATRAPSADQAADVLQRGQERYAQLRSQLRARAGDAMEQGREAYRRTKDQILSQYGRNGQ